MSEIGGTEYYPNLNDSSVVVSKKFPVFEMGNNYNKRNVWFFTIHFILILISYIGPLDFMILMQYHQIIMSLSKVKTMTFGNYLYVIYLFFNMLIFIF